MFSTLRVSIVAALLLAGAVQGAHHMGSTASCPAAPGSQKLYANSSSTCSDANTCYSAYCECLGLAAGSGPFMCADGTPRTCNNASMCASAAITCLNTASGKAACNDTNLKDLRMSIMAMEVGTVLYNQSLAYTACKYRTCYLVNMTAGDNCTLNFEDICRAPVNFLGTVLLSGDFTAILADATAREELAKAVQEDLVRALGILDIWVQRIYKLGGPKGPIRPRPARRQGADATLVVEFEAPGVSSKNTNFNTQLTSVVNGGATGAWLTSTKSTYSNLGGTGTLGFLGATEGSGSSAFSSGTLKSLVGTPAPGTPVPPTAEPPTPPTPPPTPSSGAAMHSVLAAAVVALLSALLF